MGYLIVLLVVIAYCSRSRETPYSPDEQKATTSDPIWASNLGAGTAITNPRDGLPYVYIPPGQYWMGCDERDSRCTDLETPKRLAFVNYGFFISATEVTEQAWRNAGLAKHATAEISLPVTMINWHEASWYCNGVGGRLPSEVEWEHAARAGEWLHLYGEEDKIAWTTKNGGRAIHPVGTKRPNRWGLYDMLGNAFEWTNSPLFSYANPSEILFPIQISAIFSAKKAKVVKSGLAVWAGEFPSLQLIGGPRWVHKKYLRFSERDAYHPDSGYKEVGFRCVIQPGNKP
ncbi:MAG: SUMF1/EgtB/PvdO family nonheme iron enzyme [Acidobacteria bacterium]|nr:SUMF1/EgtB/PvdO family nonheme iron enzyme [Acidobacteriota bacterium]